MNGWWWKPNHSSLRCKKMKIILPCLLVIWNLMFLLLLEEYNQKVSSEKRPFQFDQQQILTFLWNLICKYLRSSVSEKSSKKFRLARYVTICLTFPQCALSNVSSNGWHRQLHSRIGCICSIFLCCVFSNVSSNRLHKRMHNHTGYICLTSLTSHKSHWLHLFDFSPLRVFKCILKVLAREDAKSHWLHLLDFSLLWFFKCVLKLSAREIA